MSTTTKAIASRFATAYVNGSKSSVAMAIECLNLHREGVKPAALEALLRGAVESKTGKPVDVESFKKLVSQRSWVGATALTLGGDMASDPVTIEALLRVASGALPRKQSESIALKFKGSEDAPAFSAALKAATLEHKAGKAPVKPRTPRTPKAGDGPTITPESGIKAVKPTMLEVLVMLENGLSDIRDHADSPTAYENAVKLAAKVVNRHKVAASNKAPAKVAA